jgi:hypothetical protein
MISPDVVYVVRDGHQNEELRYSLRSLENLPHRHVIIVGGCPDFVNKDTVIHIPVEQSPFGFKDAWLQKYLNVRVNLRAAVNCDLVSEKFVLMNDDFYITSPIDNVPLLHYGTIDDFNSWFQARQAVPTRYVLGERDTVSWLEGLGIEEVKVYSLHVPMPIVKADLFYVLESAPVIVEPSGNPLHIRTAYGNLFGVGGAKTADVKVERGVRTGVRRLNGQRISGPVMPTKALPKPFASSSDRSFTAFDVGRWVRAMFTTPSVY